MLLKNLITASYQEEASALEAFDWLMEIGYDGDDINMLKLAPAQCDVWDEPPGCQRINHSPRDRCGSRNGVEAQFSEDSINGYNARRTFPAMRILLSDPMLIVALVGLGIPENKAIAYEKILSLGGAVIGVRPKYHNDEYLIARYLIDSGAENIVGIL